MRNQHFFRLAALATLLAAVVVLVGVPTATFADSPPPVPLGVTEYPGDPSTIATAVSNSPAPPDQPSQFVQQSGFVDLSSSQLYYYYLGQRQPLALASDLIAVQFRTGNALQQASTAALLNPMIQSAEPVNVTPSYTLLHLADQVTLQGAVDLVNQLRARKDLFAWVNPVFHVPAGHIVLTDEFIVKFPATWSYDQIRSFNAGNGVETLSPLLSNDNSYVVRVTDVANANGLLGLDALAMANFYQESGQVVYAEPDFSNLIHPFLTPNDTFFGQQYAMNNTGQTVNGVAAGTNDADIDAPEAWNITTGSSSITIAIIDTAFDSTHEDLGTGTSKLVAGYDAFTGVGGIFPVPEANFTDPNPPHQTGYDSHGTSTAGLAAAVGNNNQGISGVCSGCRLMPIRIFKLAGTVLGVAARTDQIANGINYAWQNGADILSNSWGGGSVSSFITGAIDAALANGRGGKGSVVVFASGNYLVAQNPTPPPVAYPASLTEVISVSASNLCDQVKTPTFNACNYYEDWWGPDQGSQVDVAAPGVGNYTTDIMGANGYTTGNYIPNFNGTSSATPITSGVVGLILSVNPNLTAVQVQQLLKDNADDIGPAGFDNGSGWGRVNANRAVMAAQALIAPSNDLIANATIITLPSTTPEDPFGSTTSGTDPVACAPTVNTVWFRYTATFTGAITLTTQGSSYDTVLAAYTGSPGSLSQVGCDDDSGVVTRSWLGLNVTNGTTYYIMVGKYGSSPLTGSATLKLNLSNVPTGDTLALYNTSSNGTSLVDTLQDLPPAPDYNTYTANPPQMGSYWVMGDWNGDGQKTPGVYKNGAFFYTNGIGPSVTWTGVWVGWLNVAVVAGRFQVGTAHDCIGVVELDFVPSGVGFPLHYTCDLSAGSHPISGQWLGIVLTGTDPYQFSAGDFDNNGYDSVAARRGNLIAWSNVTPSAGTGGFPLAQNIGSPHTGTSLFVAGDWNNDNVDSFGLFYPSDGYFYRRNDLNWNSGVYLLQRVGNPLGTSNVLVASWRAFQGAAFTVPAETPVPSDVPPQIGPPLATSTDEPTVEPTWGIPTATPLPTVTPTWEPPTQPPPPPEGQPTEVPPQMFGG